MSADRNLLFGLLAVQLDFVSRDAFIDALNAWQFDKARPLADLLRDGGHLAPGRRKLLDALVDEHLKQHGDDPEKSLASLASAESVLRQSLTALGDDDAQRTLRQVLDGTAADPAARPAAGRYRVLRPHARGGLGEVFVAEDTELGRHVALKEIQGRYADDGQSRQRFVLEAEITGGLEHPGIVPVYGLGAYPDGRPFYAMRFIQGDNLKDAIRRFHATPPNFAELAFRELLGRFVDVCNAVAYAHSRGVLHRDLKPGNVMLGQFGETLLVDWGLAKATGQADGSQSGVSVTSLLPRSGGDSSATVAGQALGTPAYMSPEQAAGRVADLGPATDVYSLGATLYELLTGKVPFAAANVHDLLDAVKAGRFPPPRSVQPAAPPALEAVCQKAMAREPAGRYATALALAKDVERFLADEPVAAYPEPAGVRLRRWARKHARLVTGVAAACAVALVAVGVVAWLTEKSRQAVAAERDVAREQKRRTRAALDTMISEEMLERLRLQKELTTGQREFLQKALGYYKEFAAEAATEEEGRRLEADAHFRVGYLLQLLRQSAEAEAAYRVAVTAYERLAADFPAASAHRLEFARARNNLGVVYKGVGRWAEAEAEYRAALAIREGLVAENPQSADYRRDLAASHTNLGILLADAGRRAEAAAAYRAGLAIQEALAAEFPAVADFRRAAAASRDSLGVLLAGLGQTAAAEAEYRAALAVRAALAAEHPAVPDYRRDLATSHNNLGLLLAGRNRLPPAEAAHRAALALRQALAAEYPAVPDYRSEVAASQSNLGNVLLRAGKRPDAEAAYRAAVAELAKLAAEFPALPDYRSRLAVGHNNLSLLLAVAGNSAESDAAHRAAVAVQEKLAADFPAVPLYRENLAVMHSGRGNRLSAAGQWAEAAAAYRPAVELLARLAADHRDVPAYRQRHDDAAARLASAQVRAGDAAGAVATAEALVAAAPSGGVLYDCACVFALASAASNPNADAHAARAVAVLRQAFAGGHRDVAHMLKDGDLAALRGREDYAALLWDLADGLPR